jgi:hypothetical protein
VPPAVRIIAGSNRTGNPTCLAARPGRDCPLAVERGAFLNRPLEGMVQQSGHARPDRLEKGAQGGSRAAAESEQPGALLGHPDAIAIRLPGPEPDPERDAGDLRARLALPERGLRPTSHTTFDEQGDDQPRLQHEHAGRREDGFPVALPR